MRYAARRDANEDRIIQAVELAGWKCFPISAAGWPDLLCARHGQVRLLELKTKTGRLTPAQKALHIRLQAAGLRVDVVRTPDEAVRALKEHPDQWVRGVHNEACPQDDREVPDSSPTHSPKQSNPKQGEPHGSHDR